MIFRGDPLANPEPLIRRVYAYVAYRIGDGPEAEDVVSATFERAVRYRASYERTRGEPLTWLLGIARRCIADAVAARDHTVSEMRERPDPRSLEDDALRRLSLRRAVLRLNERERELIALRYGADLTARDVADVVGMRTNAVEVALHRALARLRDELEHGDAPPVLAPRLGTAAEQL